MELNPWNKNKKIEELKSIKDKIVLLKKLKGFANPNCKICYGLGQMGYIEKPINIRDGRIIKQKIYIICPKCINN